MTVPELMKAVAKIVEEHPDVRWSEASVVICDADTGWLLDIESVYEYGGKVVIGGLYTKSNPA